MATSIKTTQYFKKMMLSVIVTLSLGLTHDGIAGEYDWEDDYSGCRILLCLANPHGPMAEQKCQRDIREFYRAVSHGDSYPHCEAKDRDLTSFTLKHDNYAFCPRSYTDSRVAGIGDITPAFIAVDREGKDSFPEGSPVYVGYTRYTNLNSVTKLDLNSKIYYTLNNPTLVGSNAFFTNASAGEKLGGLLSLPITNLACVGSSVQKLEVCPETAKNDCNAGSLVTVQVFDKIVFRKFHAKSFVADVSIFDDKSKSLNHWQRVRLGEDNLARIEAAK